MKTLGIIYLDDDGLHSDAEGHPFTNEFSTKAYTRFSEIAKERGIRAVFAHPNWVSKSGDSFTKCWDLLENKLIEEEIKIDACWDRYCSVQSWEEFEESQKLRERIVAKIPLCNNPIIDKIATDKLFAYQQLPNIIPETLTSLEEAKQKFSGKVVTKPREGAHGRDVRIVEIEDITELPENTIIQPFIDSRNGIEDILEEGSASDLRCIISNGQILDVFVRQPPEGSLVTNISKGGKMFRFDVEKLPETIKKAVADIDKKLEQYKPRYYSADFVVENKTKPWLLELNTHPGVRTYFSQSVSPEIYDNICNAIIDSFLEVA